MLVLGWLSRRIYSVCANLKTNILGHCSSCPGLMRTLVLTGVHGNSSTAFCFPEGFCSLLPQEMNGLLDSLEVLEYEMGILNFFVCTVATWIALFRP